MLLLDHFDGGFICFARSSFYPSLHFYVKLCFRFLECWFCHFFNCTLYQSWNHECWKPHRHPLPQAQALNHRLWSTRLYCYSRQLSYPFAISSGCAIARFCFRCTHRPFAPVTDSKEPSWIPLSFWHRSGYRAISYLAWNSFKSRLLDSMTTGSSSWGHHSYYAFQDSLISALCSNFNLIALLPQDQSSWICWVVHRKCLSLFLLQDCDTSSPWHF